MVGTRFSPPCSTALEPLAVWGLARRSRNRSERVWPLSLLTGPAPLSLQLLFQCIEEAPVSTLGDELLRTALDHPGLVEAQGEEAHTILGVVLRHTL